LAENQLGICFGRGKKELLQRAAAYLLPEWQVFVRRPDGRSEHFIVSQRRQSILLAGMAILAAWAVTATLMWQHQPQELASKERRLEELMASYRSGEARLDSAQHMVMELTREVDSVHASLSVLAETNAALSKDRNGSGSSVAVAKMRLATDPAYDDNGQPGAGEARAVREEVRKLEAALDRLKGTYGKVVENTTDLADQNIAALERSMERLGLDPDRLEANVNSSSGRKGQGGPFVPLPGSSGLDSGLDQLISRMEHYGTAKATLQRLPLAEPLHEDWDLNSPFGARHDPLNDRTGIHEGIDLGAPHGTPIYATGSGTVKSAGPADRYGLMVEIDHGNGIFTRYAHMSRVKVQAGQKVGRTTVIGLLGNTGRSTGAHLHYEVRVADIPRDPLKFISAGRDVPKIR
jgi:murein DD-endopeptidase MepM/ murein hydrolase activator NlpD